MATIIVQPRYPNDPIPADVAEFTAMLAEILPDNEIEIVVEEPHGHQVSPRELLFIWLPAAVNLLSLVKVVPGIVKWLRERHARDNGVRPRTVELYDARGHVIKSIEIDRGMKSVPFVRDGSAADMIRLPPKR